MKNRRDILRNAAAVSLTASTVPLLQACASTPTAPAPAPKRVALLGMLPVGPEVVMPSDEPRVSVGVTVPLIIPGRSISSRNDAIAAASVLIGIVVVGAVLAIVRGVGQGIEAKVQPIGFDFIALLNDRLLAQLRARQLSVLSMADPRLARAIRARNTESVSPEVDAILDVKVVEAFFATSWRSSGYSPTIHVSAVVREPRAGMEEVMGNTYYADNRDWGNQRRQFTVPGELRFARASDIRAHAALVETGLERVIDRMVGLIVDDVQRHCMGQPPI